MMFILCLVVLGLFSFTDLALSAVEVEQLYSVDSSYKERYPKVSTLWSLSSSPIQPRDYFRVSDGQAYQSLYGDASLSSLELAFFLRYKVSLFDVGLGLSTSQGTVRSQLEPGTSLGLQMSSAKFRIWMNSLFNEPYLVPFFGSEYHNLMVTESNSAESLVSEFPGVLTYKVGVQIQLNLLDPQSSSRALAEMGLENTFIEFSYFSLLQKDPALFLAPFEGISVGLALEF